MSAATNHFETMCLNPLRGVPSSAPAQVYVALFLTVPDEEGSGTEVSGGGYARQAVTFAEPTVNTGTVSVSNTTNITFPTAVAPWGTVLAAAIFDSSMSGNMLHYIALPTPKEIVTGTTISFVPGELTATASGTATTYWKTACLNLLRGESISAITTPHLALFLDDPGHSGGGTEVTAGDYARQAISFDAPEEQYGGNMLMENSALIVYARTSAPWGTLPYMGVMSASTGGVMLFRLACSPTVTIGASDRFTVEQGGIKLTAN